MMPNNLLPKALTETECMTADRDIWRKEAKKAEKTIAEIKAISEVIDESQEIDELTEEEILEILEAAYKIREILKRLEK